MGVPRAPRVGGPRMGQPMGQPGPQPVTMMARPDPPSGMPPVPMVGAQVRPQQSFKYTPSVRNPPSQEMLGERLFPLIQRMFPDLAGKITGMLLEIDNAELVHMLEDQNSLKGKVEEAVAVLQAHQGKAGDK